MKLPPQIRIAVATALVAGTLASAAMPERPSYESQYGKHQRRQLEENQLKATREAQALQADELRSREVRRPDDTAARAARKLFRRW